VRLDLALRWKALATATIVGAMVFARPPALHAQQIVAVVDGQPITALDVEHRNKFLQMSRKQEPSSQEALDSLTAEISQMAEAKRHGLDVSEAEVDAAYNTVATRIGIDPQKLTQLLTASGASADTLKRQLRAQIAWTKLARAGH
jgi:peptidyl-prolyl cis-trans isomerase SurA